MCHRVAHGFGHPDLALKRTFGSFRVSRGAQDDSAKDSTKHGNQKPRLVALYFFISLLAIEGGATSSKEL